MRYKMRIAVFMTIMLLAAFSVCSAYAYDIPATSLGDNISISVNGSNGITINPGKYPDLGSSIDATQEKINEKVIDKTQSLARTITGICVLIALCSFFYNVTKLSTSSNIPFARHQALMGILWSGIAISLFGGAWVVVSFFWNFLQ